MSPTLRRVLHWGGSGLALIGVVFVGFRLHSYWLDLDLSRVTPLAWSFIAVLSVIYGAANLLLALAWWHLLRHLGASATRLGSIRIYGMSQLAKYVPGNIFHLAGRQALGMAAGISAGVLAKSTIWELGSIAVAGALFGWMILPLLSPGFPEAASVYSYARLCCTHRGTITPSGRSPTGVVLYLANALFAGFRRRLRRAA